MTGKQTHDKRQVSSLGGLRGVVGEECCHGISIEDGI